LLDGHLPPRLANKPPLNMPEPISIR